jgi:hypothetical protein
MKSIRTCLALLFVPALLGSSRGAEPSPNEWVKLDRATLAGQRWDVPLAYAPPLERFMVLGGRTSWGEYRKAPRPYDQLALDAKQGQWENWFPRGKDWAPRFGPCKAPAWKDEFFHFTDTEGNTRPNWMVYGTFSLGQKYDYDPQGKRFVFYAGGRTFSYDPVRRLWKDLAPATHPEKELGGILLWSAMCYDPVNRQMVLFGGGNVRTERGDPGTWVYNLAGNTWKQLRLDVQPPQRANSWLAYDAAAKKIVLFGGDQLDQLLADTWTFDVRVQKWEQQKPALSPSPRAGHALLWLAKAKKLLLIGGYAYASEVGYMGGFYRLPPLEMWTYDTSANRWELIARWKSGPKVPGGAGPVASAYSFLAAAVDDRDNVLIVNRGNTWLCRVDATRSDEKATRAFGVKPGSVEKRSGPYDPAWYRTGVPAADPDKAAAELKALPVNRWVRRRTPKLPRPNMDWGSAVFAPELDMVLRFSGGHSAYSGTAPHIYDVKTDRYSLPFAPEMPLEYVGSNDQVAGEWSFKGNPWMTGHTYKSTGYDPRLRCLIFAPRQYTYFFDPVKGKWTRSEQRNPYRADFYNVTLCATPAGAVCWAEKPNREDGLWRLDAKSRAWRPLSLIGQLPAMRPDYHGMAYDPKRNRLLLFSMADRNKGDVLAYDLKTGKTTWLNATGKARAVVPSRETIYLPEQDAVMIGARVKNGGKWSWLVYDCSSNAWLGVGLGGEDPIGKGVFNNSLGLMYDPGRRLVWAVGQNSEVYVLRVDFKRATLHKLK